MRLSRIHHDRPIKPLDEAVFWIEFVMRNKGAKHLRVEAHNLNWYQYHCLDVIAFLIAILTVVLYTVFKMCKLFIMRCCFRSKRKSKKRVMKPFPTLNMPVCINNFHLIWNYLQIECSMSAMSANFTMGCDFPMGFYNGGFKCKSKIRWYTLQYFYNVNCTQYLLYVKYIYIYIYFFLSTHMCPNQTLWCVLPSDGRNSFKALETENAGDTCWPKNSVTQPKDMHINTSCFSSGKH